MSHCPFKMLGLAKTASQDDVLRQWRKLLLQHHPDKNPGRDTTDISRRLNDAKDRALELCVERDKGKVGRAEMKEHLARLTDLILEELMNPDHAEFNRQVRDAVARCRAQVRRPLNPTPELAAYRRLVLKLDREIDALTIQARTSADEVKTLRTRLDEETRATHRAEEQESVYRARVGELEAEYRVKLGQAQTAWKRSEQGRLDGLQSQLDDAKATVWRLMEVTAAAAGKVRDMCAEMEALNGLFNTECELIEALMKENEKLTKEVDTDLAAGQKRKHVKFFTHEEEHAFKESIRSFVVNQLVDSADGFIFTADLQQSFLSHNRGNKFNELLFRKEVRRQIEAGGFHSYAGVRQVKNKMGYRGIALAGV